MPATALQLIYSRCRNLLLPVHGPAETKAILRDLFRALLSLPVPELEGDRTLSPEEAERLLAAAGRVARGEPLQYVLGHAVFFGITLAVDPRALIPRPETEEMVDRIARAVELPPQRVIDVGTGSGCIALALKKAFPQAHVIGLDRSREALDLARSNSASTGLAVEWLEADALGPDLPGIIRPVHRGDQTLVVSNPPYVPRSEAAAMAPHVKDHEPHQALFVADDDPQLFYRAIARAARAALPAGGRLWLEAHYLHAPATAALVKEITAGEAELIHDLSGHPRFIHARW